MTRSTNVATAEPPQTKRFGSPVPRIWTPPRRELTPDTSAGYEVIWFATSVLGIKLLPWQEWFLIHAMELNPDGTFRFSKVILLVPRQNGKSYTMSVRLLWRMFMEPGTQVLSSAHKLDAAEEVWALALQMAQVSEVAEDVAKVSNTNGNKYFTVIPDPEDDKTISRWKVQASTDDAGRALTIDDMFFDELRQHRDYTAWAAMTGSMVARPNSQILAASNAGESKSLVLRSERDSLYSMIKLGNTDESDAGLFEWSAKEGRAIDDVDGWYEANPALGHTVTEAKLRSQMHSMPEQKFRTEHLCQWVEVLKESYFNENDWADCYDPGSEPAEDSELVIGIDTTPDRSKTAISIAGWRADGRIHVENIASRAGMMWVVDYVKELCDAHGIENVALQERGSRAGEFAQPLRDAGVKIVQVNGPMLTAAAGQMRDRVRNRTIAHLEQPLLELSMKMVQVKYLNEAEVFDRVNTPVNSAPAISATYAVCALANGLEWDEPRRSAYAVDDELDTQDGATKNWWE